MTDGALVLSAVTLKLNGAPLFAPLSLTIAPGSVVTLMGSSGSGKSSLLDYLCGTLDPAFDGTGSVVLDGREIHTLPPESRRLGILFQDDLLFPHLSVGENLKFAIRRDRLDQRDPSRIVEDVLAEVDLAGFANRDPATLSGGQRARIALMRTLLAEPAALLLDEPFSRLDGPLKSRFRTSVFGRATARALPCLLVTHDPDDARAANGPIIDLNEQLAGHQ